MTTAKAERFVLERLSAGATVLLSLHLSLPEKPAWCDGIDAEGCAVLLVGAHALRALPTGEAAIAEVLRALAAGELPDGVHGIAYAPKASEALAEIVAGEGVDEVLVDGPRGSGKTQMVPGALAALAEMHARSGHPLPLRTLWLHDTLSNASAKTGRSLEAPLWAGLWQLRDDRRTAVLSVGGTTMVLADFVGVQDATTSERLRAECHVIAAEEIVPSLDESGGIDERRYELALTSMRLQPTRRSIAVATTNPGDPTVWAYQRFIEGGGRPGCVRCPVPASDRLTAEEKRSRSNDSETRRISKRALVAASGRRSCSASAWRRATRRRSMWRRHRCAPRCRMSW